MIDDNPELVSVIIPTYNRSTMVKESINSALSQTYPNAEVIVIDDASTDDTEEVIRDFSEPELKYIRHDENQGGAAARNTGIKHASGRYIAFLDSDDIWKENKLEAQIDRLTSLDSSWVANYCAIIDDDHSLGRIEKTLYGLINNEVSIEGDRNVIFELLSKNLKFDGTSTLIVERDIVNEIDGFDPKFPRHQDWEFLIRVLKQGKISYTPQKLVTKRETGSPDLESAEIAVKLLLERFEEEIEAAESRGYRVKAKHYAYLCKLAYKKREFKRGTSHLKFEFVISPQIMVAILWSIMVGLTGFGDD